MSKQIVLTYLSSSSLALIALTAPADANTTPLREIVFTAPEAMRSSFPLGRIADPSTELLDCTCNQTSDNDAFADEVDVEGEMAIEALGCDCAGCRNIVRQMVEANNLRPTELRQ